MAPDGLAFYATNVMGKNKSQWIDTALEKASKVIEIGSEAADVLVHFQPNVIGVTAVGLRAVNTFRQIRLKTGPEYFSNGWKEIDVFKMENYIYDLLIEKSTPERISGIVEWSPCYIFKYENVEFGLIASDMKEKATRQCHNIYIKDGENEDRVFFTIGRMLWEKLGSTNALLSKDDDDVFIKEDNNKRIYPSRLGDSILKDVKDFNSKGHNRSLFLVGNPGTGKSCAMRYVASEFGGFSLRINIEDLGKLKESDILGCVKLLHPDVLLIDDFDRFVSADYNNNRREHFFLLSALERLNEKIKLIMVSANFSEDISEALLRPGRFDDIILVEEIDEDIINKKLEGVDKKHISQLRKMPIAYIDELSKRIEILGPKVAIEEMKSLAKRSGTVLRKNKRRSRRIKIDPKWSDLKKSQYWERQAAKEQTQSYRAEKKAEKAKAKAESYLKKYKDKKKGDDEK